MILALIWKCRVACFFPWQLLKLISIDLSEGRNVSQTPFVGIPTFPHKYSVSPQVSKTEFIHYKQRQLCELVHLRCTPSEHWFHRSSLLIEIQHDFSCLNIIGGFKQHSARNFCNRNKCRAWNYFLRWIFRAFLIPWAC